MLQATAAALLALAIGAIFPPDRIAKTAVGGVVGFVTPGPSEGESAVDSLYAEVEGSSIWESEPVMSAESKALLVRRWDGLRPDEPRPMPRRAAIWRNLTELFENRDFDGHQLLLTVFVDQVSKVEPVDDDPGLVRQSFRIDSPTRSAFGWCSDTVLPRGEALEEDQMITIAAVPIARGMTAAPTGELVGTTYFLCSAVNSLVEPQPAHEVADLFQVQEESHLWRAPPLLSEEGRRYLLVSWEETTPYRVHRFPSDPPRTLGLDQLFADDRFDYGSIRFLGYVTQRDLSPASTGFVYEQYRLSVGGQDSSIWCKTTLRSRRAFDEGDLIEAVGVPIARGSSPLAGGGFLNATMLVCPAARKL